MPRSTTGSPLARGEAFDEQPLPGLDSEALDFRAASESFAAVRRLMRRDLMTLRNGLPREVGTGPQDPKRRYLHTR